MTSHAAASQLGTPGQTGSQVEVARSASAVRRARCRPVNKWRRLARLQAVMPRNSSRERPGIVIPLEPWRLVVSGVGGADSDGSRPSPRPHRGFGPSLDLWFGETWRATLTPSTGSRKPSRPGYRAGCPPRSGQSLTARTNGLLWPRYIQLMGFLALFPGTCWHSMRGAGMASIGLPRQLAWVGVHTAEPMGEGPRLSDRLALALCLARQ